MSFLSADRLRELLAYRAEDGKFFWKQSRGRVAAGMEAGAAHNAGYIVVRVDGHRYLAHRLAWLYVFGEWPNRPELDHINGRRDDNRISNLRPASRQQNRANSCGHADSASGVKGVSFDKRRSLWKAEICVNRRSKFLGYFQNTDDAHDAYLAAAHAANGEFARG